MTENFFLRFNDFESHVTFAFQQLRSKTQYQDVTLVGDDYKQISAHRVVLSACSGYFDKILSQNTHSHPFLCLENFNSSDLNNVLDYIYNGEIQIYQEELGRFLQIAKKLQLSGLLVSNDQKVEIKLPKKLKSEPIQVTESEIKHEADNSIANLVTMNVDDPQSIDELDSKIKQLILKTGEGYECLACEKISRNFFNMKEHVETHIKGLSFTCNFCGNKFRTRSSLRSHKIRKFHRDFSIEN